MGPTRFARRAPPSVERMVYWPPAQPHVACMSDGGLRFQSRASILYLSIYQSLHCDVGVGPQCTAARIPSCRCARAGGPRVVLKPTRAGRHAMIT